MIHKFKSLKYELSSEPLHTAYREAALLCFLKVGSVDCCYLRQRKDGLHVECLAVMALNDKEFSTPEILCQPKFLAKVIFPHKLSNSEFIVGERKRVSGCAIEHISVK